MEFGELREAIHGAEVNWWTVAKCLGDEVQEEYVRDWLCRTGREHVWASLMEYKRRCDKIDDPEQRRYGGPVYMQTPWVSMASPSGWVYRITRGVLLDEEGGHSRVLDEGWFDSTYLPAWIAPDGTLGAVCGRQGEDYG